MNIAISLLQTGHSCQLLVSSLVLIFMITGCSSSGGGSVTAGVGTGGTGSVAKTITGTVADGYLVNATVFLDRNGNYRLDAGEPCTATDSHGAYQLTIDQADLGRYPLVALAIRDVTIDKDNNQTVANSYVLSVPKECVNGTVSNTFISPITSQLREMLETGIFTTLQQASDSLRQKMGLPVDTDLSADYLASDNTVMHTTAQNMATLMGRQMGSVVGSSGSSPTVDVNRYRGMMGTIFSNMSSITGGANETDLAHLHDIITTVVANIPPMREGQPYQNMSTVFRDMKGGARH